VVAAMTMAEANLMAPQKTQTRRFRKKRQGTARESRKVGRIYGTPQGLRDEVQRRYWVSKELNLIPLN
jgi:hypothetical protein